MQKNSVETQIEIHAPRKVVWDVLTDFEKMSEWSSSFQNLEGDFKQGGKTTTYFKIPTGRILPAKHTMIEFKEGYSFGWSDPLFIGVKDHHIFRCADLPNGNTLFTQTDHFHNGPAWILRLLMYRSVRKMYNTFNQELKERVEQLYQESTS